MDIDIHCIRSIRIGSYWIKEERIIHMLLDLRGSTHISPAAAAVPHAPPLRVSAATAAPHAHPLTGSGRRCRAARKSLPSPSRRRAHLSPGLDAARRPSKIRMRQGTWPKGTCWPRSGSSGKAPGYPPHPFVSLASPPDTAPVSILLAQLVFILVLSSFCYCSAHP